MLSPVYAKTTRAKRPCHHMPKRTSKLSHLSKSGEAHMVDVSSKASTAREAIAEGYITMLRKTIHAIAEDRIAKGEVLNTARIAGILAAKRTGDLIPLCHPLGLDSIEVLFDLPDLDGDSETIRIHIRAISRLFGKTGVEMESLTAVSIAALTIYDMCKAIDKAMTIDGIRLLRKTGGKSGTYIAK
jgi:cyclic pyranopterin monophosphate synthase